ncbi:MAG: hypothetical protein LBG80_19940 [Bacteroidales bacterium]|jgi:antitoxin component YwqK of YwqJK toxin-antitoxin module|nr:hypothetical protein [Bacteroidales bacterium]
MNGKMIAEKLLSGKYIITCMKRISICFILTALCCSGIYAQRLTLTDLLTLCNKKNWEDVNQTLFAKNWTYYESEKGSTYNYNTITWSYNKGADNKAQAWFYLYIYEGLPNKISYLVCNKESYSIIQNSIASSGFKLMNSEIKDDELISTYANSKYTLEISTQKIDGSITGMYSIKSSTQITAYQITLIKKAGIYDADNGKKTEYYYDGVVKTEYTLLNGKFHGQTKSYYSNGNLKKTGNYSNGKENGLFKEYDENGNLKLEYPMANGKINGVVKACEEDGKRSYLTEYKDGIKNGQHMDIEYIGNENRKLQLKQIGEYLNGEKNGTWKLLLIEDDKEQLLTFTNYSQGVKNGFFQDIIGDSLILGSYKNNKLHGEYKVYLDVSRRLFNSLMNTDTARLTLINEGSFYEGLKFGYWKNYYITGSLKSEGRFLNGQETGEWKYYYISSLDIVEKGKTQKTLYSEQVILIQIEGEKMQKTPYSEQLFLIQNYSNGKLNGKSTRFSYLEEEKYPCSENDDSKSSLDTCKKFVYQKVHEIAFYKDDILNGAFELRDSTNSIIAKGFYKNGLRDGEWTIYDSEKDIYGKSYPFYQKGNYINDKKEGKWIKYYENAIDTFNYKDGKLNGEYVTWNQYNKLKIKIQFHDDKLVKLIMYDSLEIKLARKYEIYDEDSNSFRYKETVYFEDEYVSLQYRVKKTEKMDNNFLEVMLAFAVNPDGTTKYVDGEFMHFNNNAQPLVTGNYHREDRIGLWTFYYYDQNVKIESNYEQNKQIDEEYFKLNGEPYSGKFIYNDDDSGIKEIRKIKNGLRNGKTTYIDIKTNKTIKKENYKNGKYNKKNI